MLSPRSKGREGLLGFVGCTAFLSYQLGTTNILGEFVFMLREQRYLPTACFSRSVSPIAPGTNSILVGVQVTTRHYIPNRGLAESGTLTSTQAP